MSFAITCSIFSISGTVIKNDLPYSNTLKINAKHAKTNQKTWTICNINNSIITLYTVLFGLDSCMANTLPGTLPYF